jgi:hypothetical protein
VVTTMTTAVTVQLIIFYIVSGLLTWGALSDEKSGLYFSNFAGHRQRSLSQISIFETPPTRRSRSLYLFQSQVKVTLRPTVRRPVRLGVRRPSGTCDQFFFLLQIFFRQLRVCYFVAHSLTRGQVCNLLLLLVLASFKSKSKSKSKLHYDRRSVSQCVLASSPIWYFWPEFAFTLKFLLDSYRFVIL